MIWQTVLDVIDAVESWIAGQSYWVQVVVLLAVLGPLCYLVAGVIDRLVEAVLARHSRRDLEPGRRADDPAPRSTGGACADDVAVSAGGVQTGTVTTVGVVLEGDTAGPVDAASAPTAQPGATRARATQ